MQETNISNNNFEQCVKCNICTTVCPMMAVNPHYPGPKQAGPDGERYRLKDPRFFDLTLKYCLNCKRCEVACPSGVKVGDIIQNARLDYGGRLTRPLRDTILASTDLVGSVSSPLAPVVNATLGLKPVKAVMDCVLGVDAHRTLPKYSSEKFVTWYRRHAEAEQSSYARQVSYFHGCYANYNYPKLGQDLIKILNAAGIGVRLLEKERCCGVALISAGLAKQARKQAKTNLASIRSSVAEGRTVLTTSTTCTFTMRDEYDHILGLPNEDIRSSIQLTTKWLYDEIESGRIKLAFREDYRKTFAYHTACHMEKLGWSVFSIGMLRMIPGVTLKLLPSQCCGIAGTFGFKKENYPYSQKIGASLFEEIKASGAEAVATDCETCKWQIEMSAGYPVENPVSIIADALDVEKTRQLNR